jgi:4-amino-4-deoxy-L-arabinose transferase-like glycosyltransferase
MISEQAVRKSLLPSITLSLRKYWPHLPLFGVLAVAAFLDFYGLSREGYANGYYAAAVRSMMESWHNFFFNAFDPGGFVTIDKPPLGFWLQAASAKVFGFNGVALLLPQAAAGVLSVAFLYLLVRRLFGRVAGLLAALALAVTPISVVTNRDNTIDSTLVLLVLLGAWAVTRAIESGKLRWLLLCAVFVGLGFNVKMLQAFLVVPAFGLAYLLGSRSAWWRRLVHLTAAGMVLAVISLAWVTAVDLTPSSQRPYVGSTSNNSELSLATGYNGLQRLTGNRVVSGKSTTGSTPPGGGGGPGGVGENGPAGVLRLLDTQLGSQIGWLFPIALIGLLAAAWRTRRRGWQLDTRQSALALWGAWLLTTGVFFSVAGFFHTYYLIMVAPAIGALFGIGVVALFETYSRRQGLNWILLPTALIVGAAVQVHILADYPGWSRWLSPLILTVTLGAAAILLAGRFAPLLNRRVVILAASLGAVVLLAAPAAWAAYSLNASNGGAILHAGPTAAGAGGALGYFGEGRRGLPGTRGETLPPPGAPPPSGGPLPGAPPGGPTGGIPGSGARLDSQVNGRLLSYLEYNLGHARFLFATTSATGAEGYIIATGKPVMALGGFTGGDPILTVAKLAALVKQGVVRYFLLSGTGLFAGPGGRNNGALTSWVQSTCTAVPASKYSSSSTSSGPFGGGQLYACGSAS